MGLDTQEMREGTGPDHEGLIADEEEFGLDS